MTNEVAPMITSDRFKNMGLAAEIRLHAIGFCNNVRLSATAEELAVEIAQANGFVAGMLIGKAISKLQHDQLVDVFRVMAQVTQAQHAVLAEQLPPARRLDGLEESVQELLADTIRDLARQVSPEFRGQFYGECRGLLKALRLGDMLDEGQREQWSADIYRASLHAAEQCAAAGQPADEAAVNRQRFQLGQLIEQGITPRKEDALLCLGGNEREVLPVDQTLEALLQKYHLGVAPMWRDGQWLWAGYVARRNEPTDWSYAKDPRSAVLAAIAALPPRKDPINLR